MINNDFKTIGVFGKYVTIIILMGNIVTAQACHIIFLIFQACVEVIFGILYILAVFYNPPPPYQKSQNGLYQSGILGTSPGSNPWCASNLSTLIVILFHKQEYSKVNWWLTAIASASQSECDGIESQDRAPEICYNYDLVCYSKKRISHLIGNEYFCVDTETWLCYLRDGIHWCSGVR